VWRVISSAPNLITVIETVRRKLHTTLNNIFTVLTLAGIELENPKSPYIQGHREGVKGVTVSWGPDLKRGPGNHENKRKTG
jgi:hypothetical protein